MAKRFVVAALALGACSGDGLPTDPPKKLTKVAEGGFTSPSDAVASPDGRTFYFAAYDDQKQPSLWKTSSKAGSTAQEIACGDPLGTPIGLVLSCDGKTLYVADLGGDDSAVLAVATSGGTPSDLGASGIVRPGGRLTRGTRDAVRGCGARARGLSHARRGTRLEARTGATRACDGRRPRA